jgi:hypothetical protein
MTPAPTTMTSSSHPIHAPYGTTPAWRVASPALRAVAYPDDELLEDEREDDEPDELEDPLLELEPELELEELDEEDALLDELDDELDDELLALEELDDELDDELLVVDELDEPADELLELLMLDELDEVPPPPDELLAADDPPSGDVGVVVQPDVRPAAMTAAGAPDSNNRNSRRLVSSAASVAGFGWGGGVFRFFTASSSQSGQRQGAAPVVQLDPPDDLVGGNHVHAPRQATHHVHTQRLGAVVHIAVAERQGPRLPAAAVVATPECAHRVNELVVGIGREVWRLAASGHDDAGPVFRHAGLHLHRCGQVHQETHGRERALGVVHEPNELAVRRAPAQIDDPVERRMIVVVFAHLHEEQATPKVVDDGLVARRVPPFDRVVELAARSEQPEGRAVTFERLDLAEPVLLRLVDVEVAAEFSDADPQAQLLVQVFDETVEEVPRLLIAAVDERVVAVEHLHVGVIFQKRRQVRVVVPEVRAGRADVGQELAGVAAMQVTHRGGQHHDVARRLEVLEDELSHTPRSGRRAPSTEGRGVPRPPV